MLLSDSNKNCLIVPNWFTKIHKFFFFRFTSTVYINDAGPAISTAHKLYDIMKEKLSQWTVTFVEGEISVESVMITVEGEESDNKGVRVTWTNQDEDIGSYVLNLINTMGE